MLSNQILVLIITALILYLFFFLYKLYKNIFVKPEYDGVFVYKETNEKIEVKLDLKSDIKESLNKDSIVLKVVKEDDVL